MPLSNFDSIKYIILEPADPLFSKISAAFVEYNCLFGTDIINNSDLFNEMTPKTTFKNLKV
ncbi:hypothetical protein B4U80_04434 [Leptotrombidium deliense]|uniref:Alpha-N-acetylglucosaminidase tim-barrel domain-containing protein n=1 Tax=Leptotrombidium deliense TaxID=299467 RepID=A0A443QU32_9ACAR|nr:hypothetical protein B4U80_04434 [Leptotrombidium deliense]